MGPTVRYQGSRAAGPKTLTTLQAGPGPSLFDVGALVAVGTFALGWVALAVVTLRARILSRGAAILVIAGFFATPSLQPLLPGVWGAVVSNSILGAGWFWLGYEIGASPRPITGPSRGLLTSDEPGVGGGGKRHEVGGYEQLTAIGLGDESAR